MLIACLQIKRPEDLKSLCLTSKSLRAIATPPLYRTVFLSVGGHRDIRVSGLLSRTNPGFQHIRKVYLHLEKAPYQNSNFQANSDDSSEDEVEVKLEDIAGGARQAQFIVRLLLDFLPNDILETFRWVPFPIVHCHRYFLSKDHCPTSLAWAQSISSHLVWANSLYSWQNWEPFSMDNWLLLMKKQKRLKAVEVNSTDRELMSTCICTWHFPF